MSNENITAVEFSLSDRLPFDYVSCEGLRETRSCYHKRRSATAHWRNAPAHFKSTDRARFLKTGVQRSTQIYIGLIRINLVPRAVRPGRTTPPG